MRKKDETLDIAVIVSGVSIIPLLMFSVHHPNLLGYAIVMIMTTITLARVAEKENEKWRKDYTKRAIRERKQNS
jgi:hypothetical protein